MAYTLSMSHTQTLIAQALTGLTLVDVTLKKRRSLGRFRGEAPSSACHDDCADEYKSALLSLLRALLPRLPKPDRPSQESRRIGRGGGFCFLEDDGDTGDAALRGMRQILGWQG